MNIKNHSILKQIAVSSWMITSLLISGSGTAAFGQPVREQLVVATGDVVAGKRLTEVGGLINNAGNVVYEAGFLAGLDSFGNPIFSTGIFSKGKLLVQFGDIVDGKTLGGISAFTVNNSGRITFWGSFSAPSEDGGLVFGNGILTPTKAIVVTGDVISGKTLTNIGIFHAANDAGEVAFLAEFEDIPGVPRTGLFTRDQLLVATGDAIGGRVISGFGNPYGSNIAMNNAGVVVYYATLADGGDGIFTPDELIGAVGEQIDGKIITAIGDSSPSINNAGQVVFTAQFDDGEGLLRQGIFTKDELIVQDGDVVSGQLLVGFQNNPRINSAGRIAYRTNQGLFRDNVLIAGGGSDSVAGKTIADPGILAEFDLNDSGTILIRAAFLDDEGITQTGLFTINKRK